MLRRKKIFNPWLFFIMCVLVSGITLISLPVSAEVNESPSENVTDMLSVSPASDVRVYTLHNSSEERTREPYDTNVAGEGRVSSPLSSELIGTETLLSTVSSGTDQEVASIWEDRVVWRSRFADPANPPAFLSDLFLYTISTGECTRIGSNLSALTLPDIWQDRVVWSSAVDGNFEVFLYNISTDEIIQITNDSLNQMKPQIWGDHIVWQEGEDSDPVTGVHLFSIRTGSSIQIDPGSGYAMSPAIWEDRIVWQDGRNGNDYDLFLFNRTSGTETQVTYDPAWQTNPALWGDSIVWEDARGFHSAIYRYDITTGNESQLTSGEEDQLSPRIYDRQVIYQNGSAIYLINLSTMQEVRISPDDGGFSRQHPAIWNNRMTWNDNRNGDEDVYLFTVGITMPPLEADFSGNTTQGPPPLVVAFSDASSGQTGGWHWDFGDGNRSLEQNPVHTYAAPGSYSVTLTVHNPWQRSGIRKGDLISVGSAPVPGFSLNLTSGPAPLMVQFTDETAGLPTSWEWEFGDGESSAEKDPIHRYDHAGMYDIHLTVSSLFGNATLSRPAAIHVVEGTPHTCILPEEGIVVNTSGSDPVLSLDTRLAGNCALNPMEAPVAVLCLPDEGTGIAQIGFYAKDGAAFILQGNDTISGTLGHVEVTSRDVAPRNFSDDVGGNSRFNYTVTLSGYSPGGVIDLVAWEGSTPDDLTVFNHICSDHGYVRVEDVAYTVRFTREGLPENGSAVVILGVGPEWVDRHGWRWCNSLESVPPEARVFVDSLYYGTTPLCIGEGLSPGNHTVRVSKAGYAEKTFNITLNDKRDSIHVIRIGDDGTGEVLDTAFIGHDPERNLDFFRAESPNGLSTFGLASLSNSGNILQLINLLISGIVGGGGGSGGGGGGGRMLSSSAAPAPTTIPPAGTGTSTQPVEPRASLPEETPGPEITTVHPATPPQGEPTPAATGSGSRYPRGGLFPEGTSTLILLKNLSIVFVVIFIAVIFYLRWKR